MTDKPKTSDPEPIIELVDHLPVGYLVVAFLAGAAIVFAIIVLYGNRLTRDEQDEG